MTQDSQGFSRRALLKSMAAAGVLAGLPVVAVRAAERFPAKPVTIIVPYAAGGTVDLYFRDLAKLAAKHLGQSILVENKAGAGGAMGAIQLARVPKSDGYTLAVATEGLLRLPYLEQVEYDINRDFTYVIGLAAFNFGLAVRKDSPFNSLAEVIRAGRERPGAVNYAAGNANTTMPLMMAKVAKDTGTRLLHVPFRSGIEMLQALLGGHVDMIMDSSGGMGSQIDAGTLRLLATFGETRSLRWPGVPTAKELGVDATGILYFGLVAAKDLDSGSVSVLHDALRKAIAEPEHTELLKKFDMLPWYQSPGDFKDIFARGYKRYGEILQQAGMRKK